VNVATWEPGVTTEQHPEAASDDFVDLFVSHYSRLVAALRLGGADAASAEDLAQEAFARTLGHWRRVRHGSNPAGYVYRVAFRLLARRNSRWREAALGDTDLASGAVGPEDQAVDGLEARAALDAMPPRRRVCAALVWYLGFSAEEAGAILGITGATVRTQLERARATPARR